LSKSFQSTGGGAHPNNEERRPFVLSLRILRKGTVLPHRFGLRFLIFPFSGTHAWIISSKGVPKKKKSAQESCRVQPGACRRSQNRFRPLVELLTRHFGQAKGRYLANQIQALHNPLCAAPV